jgi:hypothetical protein
MPALESVGARPLRTSGGLVLAVHAEMSSGSKATETIRYIKEDPDLSSRSRKMQLATSPNWKMRELRRVAGA